MIRMFIQDWWYLNWKMERRNVHNVHTKCTQYVWSMMSYVTMSKQNWKCKHQNGRFITRKLFWITQKFSKNFKNFLKLSKKRNAWFQTWFLRNTKNQNLRFFYQFQNLLLGYLPLKMKIIKRSELYCEFNEKQVFWYFSIF